MRCPEVARRLAEYQLGGLGLWVRGRVRRHLRGCASCRAEEAALARTGRLLSQLELEARPEQGWESLHAQLARTARARAARPVGRWVLAGALTLVLCFIGMRAPRILTRPPVTPAPAVADQDMKAAVEAHLSALYSAPLADPAAVGLRLETEEDDS